MIKTIESRVIWAVIMTVSSAFMMYAAYLTTFISNTNWSAFVFWLIVSAGLSFIKLQEENNNEDSGFTSRKDR